MGRIVVLPCPHCEAPGLRRVYLQNPATSDRPRHEPIEGWLYCDSCKRMQGGQITHRKKRQSNP